MHIGKTMQSGEYQIETFEIFQNTHESLYF